MYSVTVQSYYPAHALQRREDGALTHARVFVQYRYQHQHQYVYMPTAISRAQINEWSLHSYSTSVSSTVTPACAKQSKAKRPSR